jgi:drug/metabolite transporter (DMT)-like permease
VNSQATAIPQQRTKGILLVLFAAILWGISGTVAQFLFHKQGFSVEWLVVVRLLSSGILLLWFSQKVQKQPIWFIWKTKLDVIPLLMFGILGMLGVQYTYFAAIETGNAATATVLQYLAPIIICCYLCVRAKEWPAKHELLAIILALSGTFFLVTNGNLNALSISGQAFFWGILSAFALAFYTVYPSSLLSKWGSLITVGWGMLIGGIGLSFIHPPWDFRGTWSISSLAAVFFVIIFGTLIAFICFMESLKYIRPSEASLLACAEPLSASFLAVVWLQVSFSMIEWLGAFCIILAIFVLSAIRRQS